MSISQQSTQPNTAPECELIYLSTKTNIFHGVSLKTLNGTNIFPNISDERFRMNVQDRVFALNMETSTP